MTTPAAPVSPLVTCPSCGGSALFAPSNPWRPFCSERCKRIDLGAWAAEEFRVASEPKGDPEAESIG